MTYRSNYTDGTELSNKWDYKASGFSIYKIALINFVIGFGLNLIMNFRFIFSVKWIAEVCIGSVVTGVIIWKGAELITIYLVQKYPWFKNPAKRITLSLLYLFLYSAVIVLIINSLIRFVFQGYSWSNFVIDLPFILLLSFFFTLVSNLIIYAYIFLKNWKSSVLHEEVLKSEQLALQYESLKTQVNPQLLFNSLNMLKLLIRKDSREAAQYVKQLSEVYRFTLDQRDKEVIELTDELKFLNDYYALIKVQFANKISLEINLNDCEKAFILPLSLQIIIEEVILNTDFDNGHETCFQIEKAGNYLLVQINSNYIDLNNNKRLNSIKNRYGVFTHLPFVIEYFENNCRVKIPLIEAN
jgi:two-component system LytT family sensor kinase